MDEEDFDRVLAERSVATEIERIEGRELELHPWLKPRKQHVRRAWRENIDRLIKRLHVPAGEDSQAFRYLTLPGEDMLDIRSIKPAIEGRGFRVKYVGFNSSRRGSAAERRLSIAQNSLRSQEEWVHEGSTILWHQLEEVAGPQAAIAFSEAEKLGPYHAINFDLCGHLAYRSPAEGATAMDALGKLVQMQAEKCHHDWLLFIATRVEKACVEQRYLDAFISAIGQNSQSSEKFSAALDDLVRRYGADQELALTQPDALSDEAFRDLFCLGLAKWLLGVLGAGRPPFGLRMLRSYVYSVSGRSPDMLSLVFRCESGQRAGGDPAGLLIPGARRAPADADEEMLAVNAVSKTKDLVDLDRLMAEQDGLKEELAEETAGLLREASYQEGDIGRYLDWAMGAEAAPDS